jgi:hypothetical protein
MIFRPRLLGDPGLGNPCSKRPFQAALVDKQVFDKQPDTTFN